MKLFSPPNQTRGKLAPFLFHTAFFSILIGGLSFMLTGSSLGHTLCLTLFFTCLLGVCLGSWSQGMPSLTLSPDLDHSLLTDPIYGHLPGNLHHDSYRARHESISSYITSPPHSHMPENIYHPPTPTFKIS